MSFFEPPPPPPPRRPSHRPPPWHTPPENELGVSVPVRLLLARTDEFALGLADVVAYSTGFSLRLALRLHPKSELELRVLMPQLHGFGPRSGDDQLRFGVEFSDGRRATNLGARRPPHEQEPAISLVTAGGGGGGGKSFNVGYWVYPLPSPGPVTVAVEWPSQRVRETQHALDGDAIIEAGAGSERLWDDERPIGPGPGWQSTSGGTVLHLPEEPPPPRP
jgi:hypothetical protein